MQSISRGIGVGSGQAYLRQAYISIKDESISLAKVVLNLLQ
jgi:hypothetical protein